MPAQLGTSTLRTSEKASAEALIPFWKNSDLTASYPSNTATVVKLMHDAEYECGPDTVEEFIRKGYVTGIPTLNGQFRWRASDIAGFANALEIRRRWRWDSRMHAAKWHAFEVQHHMARTAGFEHPFEDLESTTIEDLLLLMVRADREDIRLGIRLMLSVKLAKVLENE
jgi:hypothetical protein